MYEVYRLTPDPEHYYFYAEYTKKTCEWNAERYFTSEKPKLVGKFTRRYIDGYNDNINIIDTFIGTDEKENRVNYSYCGRTSFVEITAKEKIYGSWELIMHLRENKDKPKILLEELVKNAFSPKRVLYILDNYEKGEDYCFNS